MPILLKCKKRFYMCYFLSMISRRIKGRRKKQNVINLNACVRSSAGQSTSLLRKGSGVRIASGAPLHKPVIFKNNRELSALFLTKMGEGFIFLNAFQNSWGVSSAGRAPPWHGGGREFDPLTLHQEKANQSPKRRFFCFNRMLL